MDRNRSRDAKSFFAGAEVFSKLIILKGQCHEVFDPWFFIDQTHLFCFAYNIPSNSAIYSINNEILQYQLLCRDHLRDDSDTAMCEALLPLTSEKVQSNNYKKIVLDITNKLF
jgi:hypothetical protein